MRCTECHGHKTVECLRCDGNGYTRITRNPAPGRIFTVNEPCNGCTKGRIRCPHCKGSGTEPQQ